MVLFYNSKRKKSVAFASSVEKTLKGRGVAVIKICVNPVRDNGRFVDKDGGIIPPSAGGHTVRLRRTAFSNGVNDPVRDFKKADAAVTVGGDGTVLYAARQVIKYGMPVLGINAGGMGFLSGVERSGFRRNLDAFLGNRFKKIKRRLLAVEVRRRAKSAFGPYPALNDCVIRSAESRAFTLKACFGSSFLSEYFGDGLIISTPTGSTAYNLAVFGPIVLPELEVFLLSPICPHTLTHRPIVLPSGEDIRITVGGKSGLDHRVTLSLDGQENFELKSADEIIIRKYPVNFEMLVPEKFSYFDILRKKLNWGKR